MGDQNRVKMTDLQSVVFYELLADWDRMKEHPDAAQAMTRLSQLAPADEFHDELSMIRTDEMDQIVTVQLEHTPDHVDYQEVADYDYPQSPTRIPTEYRLGLKCALFADTSAETVLRLANKRVVNPDQFRELFSEDPVSLNSPQLRPDSRDVFGATPPGFERTISLEFSQHSSEYDEEVAHYLHGGSNDGLLLRELAAFVNVDKLALKTSLRHIVQQKEHCEVVAMPRSPPQGSRWAVETHVECTTFADFERRSEQIYFMLIKELADYETRTSARKAPIAQSLQLRYAVCPMHISELSKLPSYCNPTAPDNVLMYINGAAEHLNNLEAHVLTPEARLLAQRELNGLGQFYLNTGDSDIQWNIIGQENFVAFQSACLNNGVDFLKDNIWPDEQLLMSQGIKVKRVRQAAMDILFLSPGSIYWAKSIGWTTILCWKYGALFPNQLRVLLRTADYNRCVGEANAPIEHIIWNVARYGVVLSDSVLKVVREFLINSLANVKMLIDYVESIGKPILLAHPQFHGPQMCCMCKREVFGMLFARDELGIQMMYCVYCALRQNFEAAGSFQVFMQGSIQELANIYDSTATYEENDAADMSH